MDSELLYLKKRVNFHRRMARRAVCGEARCAHDAFVRAYLARIEDLTRQGGSLAPTVEPGRAHAHRPVLSPALSQ